MKLEEPSSIKKLYSDWKDKGRGLTLVDSTWKLLHLLDYELLSHIIDLILFSIFNIYSLLNNNVKTRKLSPFLIKFYKKVIYILSLRITQ